MKTILNLGLACLFVAPIAGRLARAADPIGGEAKAPGEATAPKSKPAPASSSLDDELFKDLDDGTGRPKSAAAKTEPAKPGAAPPTTKPDPATKPEAGTQPETVTRPIGDAHPVKTEVKPLPKPSTPLDAELLKGLEGDAPESKKPKQPPKPAPAGAGKPSESDDPLERLSRRIRDAESRIRRSESGEETQRLQRDIVEDLEKLIASIEQQQSKSQSQPGQGSPKPGSKPGDGQKPGSQPGAAGDDNQPAKDSNDDGTRKMAAKKADPGRLKNMLDKVWGNLPERERQDVIQPSVDDFPVKYQYVIEEYFRTLIERRD